MKPWDPDIPPTRSLKKNTSWLPSSSWQEKQLRDEDKNKVALETSDTEQTEQKQPQQNKGTKVEGGRKAK